MLKRKRDWASRVIQDLGFCISKEKIEYVQNRDRGGRERKLMH